VIWGWEFGQWIASDCSHGSKSRTLLSKSFVRSALSIPSPEEPYYADFDRFKSAIETCLETANTTHKKSLETLLSLNFQSFKDVHISAAYSIRNP
jgi:hypothetical protein